MLSHLCFTDDLLVFTNGTKRSLEEVLKVFPDFEAMCGLKISLESSTLYVSCISEAIEVDILVRFMFSSRKVHVRYLGFPLLTNALW